jgi:hypothetical protein
MARLMLINTAAKTPSEIASYGLGERFGVGETV